ncbi:condensation domain-containing protein [Streptosporangium roseum]|uniref:condensation domain-containing protein n=1 Tax=Streptosporangium roseum TaxID=2001 RepID=UPI000689956E|nr:condensation domain-containing protein [Streptosporangium roseum]
MDIRFSGSRSGTAPLTWGQRAIWDTIQKTAPDDHYFNFGRVLKVPRRARPLTVERAVEVLGTLVERHGSLRTRLGAGPSQVLETSGAIAVTLSAGDPDRLLDTLAERAFDYAGEWPLRVGLVVADETVTHIVLVFCHLAADGLGAEAAITDLRLLLLRGAVPGPPPPSPLDLARWQRSEQGLRVARIAAEHWESEYRRIPPTMFDRPVAVPEGPPVWRAQIVSRALDLAVQRIAALHGVSTSTVLLAASSMLVGAVTGHDVCAMLPIVGNRFRADTANAVTTLSQEGLFVLDLRGDATFADLLRRAKPAALRAYRSAYHDPDDRDRLTARISRERGAEIHPYCCFNDMRFVDRVDASHDERTVRQAMAETALTWPLSQDRLNCRFCLHVTGEPGGLGVSLTADTRFLPRPAMERYLYDLESLLVEAAFREVLEPVG